MTSTATAFLPPTALRAPAALRASTALSTTGVRLSRPPAWRVARVAPHATLRLPEAAATLLERAREDTQKLLTAAPKTLAALALIAALCLPVNDALAASSGGRIGGSSFRSPAPSRVAPAPRGGYSGSYSGGYGYGGGFYGMPGGMYMSPIIMPFGGFGLGGFGSLILFATAAAFVYDAVRTRGEESELQEATDPVTTVTCLKIGLLANAREVQEKLEQTARSADTATVQGLKKVLDDTVVALMRNDDYWVYGAVSSQTARLSEAESTFARAVVEERVKLDEETLSNAGGQLSESEGEGAAGDGVSEFIVVSVLLAATGEALRKLEATSAAEMSAALGALGGVATAELQALQVLWAPQRRGDVLSLQQMLRDHPQLTRL